jgi:hypothetical protein
MIAQIMWKMDRARGSITNTIEQWCQATFTNPVLNKIWQLIPRFVVWKIWKERNKRIFQSKHSSLQQVWSKIYANIQETVRAQTWSVEDLTCNPSECIILSNWHLNLH